MWFGCNKTAAVAALMFIGLGGSVVSAAIFYAAPNGSSAGDGSVYSPWNLQFALSRTGIIDAGDTLLLRGGTYHGTFTSYLHGAPGSPVIVRQMPGERAIIDGGNSNGRAILTISGNYSWFWGFEVMSSDRTRVSSSSSSWPSDIPRGEGVLFDQTPGHGIGTKLIDMVIHDARQGVSFWKEAENSEIYGCIIFNNGWDGPPGDRGHGHGIYTQNQIGTKRIVDNIIFHQFSHGIHAYGSSSAYLDNFYLQGNILFDSGAPSVFGLERNVLIGGGTVAQNITFLNNYSYDSVTKLGYEAPVIGLTMAGNYLATDSNTVELNASNVTMNGNTYIGGPTNDISGFRASSFPNNAYVTTHPKGVNVIVRPSYYVRGRANVVIYNWDLRNSVAVDLSRVLKRGDLFEIRDVQNFFGPPIAIGTYTGSPVAIPMRAPIHVAQPIGEVRVNIPNTRPQFGVFVVLLRAR